MSGAKREENMKKLSVILASLVLALGLVFAAACKEEGAKEQPLEGTYTFESLTYTGEDGTSVTLRAGDSWLLAALTEDTFTFELREDGTATFTAKVVFTVTIDLKWEESEEEGYIDITLDGATEKFPCDGTTIGYTYEGASVTMKKK